MFQQIGKKRTYKNNSGKRLINVVMKINSIMQKVFAITVIISMVEPKSLGTVHMTNFMLLECVKIVTSIVITKRRDSVKIV